MKSLLLAGLLFLSSVVFSQDKGILQQGTVIELKLLQSISTKDSKVGDIVDLEVSEPVIGGDKVLIQKGTKAIGQISELVRPAMRGKSGKLSFTIDYLTLSSGKKIKVKSIQSATPKDILINFTVGKGRAASFDKGYSCKGFIDETINL